MNPGDLLTPPLSIATIARYHGCRWATMKTRLRLMAERGDAEQYGAKWQVKLSRMPATYWADLGWKPDSQ